MKVVAIIQARMGSTRLPQKIMTDLCGKPMLWHIVKRVANSKMIDDVVIATSTNSEDDAVEQLAKEYGISLWRGSQENVLERFYDCATYYHADLIVRLTGDNALVDSSIIDMGISYFKEHEYDYVSYRKGLPIGMIIEIFSYVALKKSYENAEDIQCLEHVTPYIYKNPHMFQIKYVPCIGTDYSYLRWTMDTEYDKQLITEIYQTLYHQNKYFTFEEILKEYEKHPQWLTINGEVKQNQVTYQGENKE